MDESILAVNYQIDVDDPAAVVARRFTMRSSWPWQFPPREGDYVAPHPDLPLALQVRLVILRPGSKIIQVIFTADGLGGDAADQRKGLREVGFTEASSTS